MKIRNGFVSNSSSSSFVIQIPTESKDEFIKDLKNRCDNEDITTIACIDNRILFLNKDLLNHPIFSKILFALDMGGCSYKLSNYIESLSKDEIDPILKDIVTELLWKMEDCVVSDALLSYSKDDRYCIGVISEDNNYSYLTRQLLDKLQYTYNIF